MRKLLVAGAVCLMTVLGGNVLECRAEEVEQRVVLTGVEAIVGVPEELLVEVEGTEEYVPVKSVKVLREYWTKDFEFPVLFYVYDAEFYELGEYRIPRGDDSPGLQGYEEKLLEVLGLGREDYVIEKVDWNGDFYVNEEGIQCRNAVARGQKRVRDYELVYGRELEPVTMPEPSVVDLKETQVMSDAPDRVNQVTVEEAEGDGPASDLWSILRRVTVVTVAAGLVLLLLFLLIFLFRRFIKRNQDRKREKSGGIREKQKDLFDYSG